MRFFCIFIITFASGEKEEYRKEEILEMLDKIELAKEQVQTGMLKSPNSISYWSFSS
jgi:hypothetical protein